MRGRNPGVCRLHFAIRKVRDKPGPDATIARIASNQHGVVTAAQLASAGPSPASVTRRRASSRLHRIHRGVYAVGHCRLSDRGPWMAAVMACGAGAVLSHLSAAELWGIERRIRWPSEAGNEIADVHVTVPTTAGIRTREGIALHRSSTLLARDTGRREGIPVTTPTRTLADLRPILSPARFSAAVREAEFLGLPVTDPPGSDRTRTELERRLLAICRRHRLPGPEVNVRVDRFEVDFLWPSERLIVEVDGWQSHRGRTAFEADRARDARLKLLGYDVLRFTWRQVTRERAAVTETIRTLLAARAA